MIPIGSIVYLKEGRTKLMIMNRAPFIPSEETGKEGIWYDYSACVYPYGLDPKNVIYFNEENIVEVVFEGFKDEEDKHFQKLFQNWLIENQANIKKGTVAETFE